MDGFYLTKDAYAWWCELRLEDLQWYDGRGPRFVAWQSLEMFALPPNQMNDFYAPVPQCWEHESNRSLVVPTAMIFSFLADHLPMCGSKVQEDLVCIEEFKILFMTHCALLQSVCHEGVNRQVPDDVTHVCSKDGVLIQVSQGVVQKSFDMGISRVLRRMHCTPVLAVLAIA